MRSTVRPLRVPRARRRSAPGRLIAAALAALLTTALAVVVAGPSGAAPVVNHNPVSGFNGGLRHQGYLTMSGWTFDPDSPTAPVQVLAYVDGTLAARGYATVPRSDVARAYPAAGPNHGFALDVPVAEGTHTICVWASNLGPGTGVRVGCAAGVFDYGPVVMLDTLDTQPGKLHIRGWAYDDDNPTAAISLLLGVDSGRYNVLANLPRPDVASRLHGGIYHGFEVTMPAPQGTHSICLTAHNIGLGGDTVIPCRSLVLNDSPVGAVETAAQRSGALLVSGWTFDRDTPTTPSTVRISLDNGPPRLVTANVDRPDIATRYPGVGPAHGFSVSLPVTEGNHTVTVTAVNVGYGSDTPLGTFPVTINFTPQLAVGMLGATSTNVVFNGWAFDPDTSGPVGVRIYVDDRWIASAIANGAGRYHPGHWWGTTLMLPSGSHAVCAVVPNVLYGTHDAFWCRRMTFTFSPVGRFDSLQRAANGGLTVAGWAADADTATAPSWVGIFVDGQRVTVVRAASYRADVARAYPQLGGHHGLVFTVPADAGEHTVCLTAYNAGPGGTDQSLGCALVIAVHPVPTSAPQSLTAVGGYGSGVVTWQPPASDGGAPVTSYTIRTVPDGLSVTVPATYRRAGLIGLRSHTNYYFTVTATNAAGVSVAAVSPTITTQTTPPPQTTPAPVSTSRYIRNIRGSSPAELATMRAEGAADAAANPSGHGYMILLDIGGQYGSGVLLSATTRYVAYTDLVRDIQAYVDGYHSAQRASAPVTIAIGTNNDINVSAASGQAWADQVVDPVRAWAAKYSGMVIAGANDIEPGFNANYAQTSAWLSGYLGATSAPFVFNGSADGCAWTVINRGCNNGWSMYGLYQLAAGAAPTRIVNLPQIYNTTMAAQWKYISLTGVAYSQPRIVFGGPLTEWTACDQSGGCGSMTGPSAWSTLWANLQSDSRLRVSSLPYSTDLRVDS